MTNITDDIVDGHPSFICLTCGATHRLLHYELTPQYDFPVISTPKSIAGNEAFVLKHSLCKVPEQIELF